MSDEFDDDAAGYGGWDEWDDDSAAGGPGSGSGPGPSDDFDEAAERDKLLGALAEAMGNKDSAATRQLIEDLQDYHGNDTNIDQPLEAALQSFRDWGDPALVFEACRLITDWARRDQGPKQAAMGIILDLAKQVGEKSIRKAEDGLSSVLSEAPANSSYRAGALEGLFNLAANAAGSNPEATQKILKTILRSVDDGSAEHSRAIDALIALAESCRDSDPDLALDAASDALYALPDCDPRRPKLEDFQNQLEGLPGKMRAEEYRENAKPLSPDEFRQRFG
jgi:hypothetical protein